METVVSNTAIVESILKALNDYRCKIDDIYYDWKSENDLEFEIYTDYGQVANDLTQALSNIPYTVASNRIRWHVLAAREVTLVVYNLAIKNELVDRLRKDGWQPNGG